MTTIEASPASVTEQAADALILGVGADDALVAHPLVPQALLDAVAPAAKGLDASGKLGKTVVVPGALLSSDLFDGDGYRRVVLVGIGKGDHEALRQAAGAAARAAGSKPQRVVVALPFANDREASAIAEGAALGAYAFTDYKSSDEDAERAETAWVVPGASDAAIERAKTIAAAVAGVRDLVNTPPLDLYPAALAAVAQDLGSQVGCDVRVWEPEQLAQEGFGGILAVGMGSSRLPRLVRIAWTPEGADQTVAIVGKGITFDTGGISLKPSKSMETMKSDMAGAASVLHTVVAAARAQLPVNVVGWLCIAENMPSGTAQRPSDVIRIYNGTTVEVLNTDAEGRLVLADGLARAAEEEPDLLLDIATLTGAQGLALGTRTSAVMGHDEPRAEVVAAADAAGELMWPMPMPEHLYEGIKSKVADIQNMGDPSGGGMLTAAIFLEKFVGDRPWAHLDIARPAFNEGGAWGYTVPGGTGHGVRTLFEVLERRAGTALQ